MNNVKEETVEELLEPETKIGDLEYDFMPTHPRNFKMKNFGKTIIYPDKKWLKIFTLIGNKKMLHRNVQEGPAVEYSDGAKQYMIEGKRHNPLGPAVLYANGDEEYWYENRKILCDNLEDFLTFVKYGFMI